MAMAASTKDCTSLSDTELVEMADLSAEREVCFDIGFVSKQREEWVLVTQAREGTKLRGYSFCTLERIGGTPSLLVGLATTDRTTKAESALKAMMADQYRRALLAFPDEDVLLGTQLLSVGRLSGVRQADRRRAPARPPPERRGAGLGAAPRQALRGREPARRPDLCDQGHRPARWRPRLRVGEVERPRRRSRPCSSRSTSRRGDRLVAFGWAMAEDLAAGRLGR